MPVQAEDGGANGLLDVLAHPPGYGSQTGREKREAEPLTSVSGASVPQELQAPTALCPADRCSPRENDLGTVSRGAFQDQVQASNVWEGTLYPVTFNTQDNRGQAQ